VRLRRLAPARGALMWLKRPYFAVRGHGCRAPALVVLLDGPVDTVREPRLATYARQVLVRGLPPITLGALLCLGAPVLVAVGGGEPAARSEAFPPLFALAVLPLLIRLLRARG
jgi:hypothetical protein